jgi:hypothetical protein
MYDYGALAVGVVSSGQGVVMVHDILIVEEFFDRMTIEANAPAGRFTS